VEYRDEASIDNVLVSSQQFPNVDHIPVQSRLLYYHPGRDRLNNNATRRVFPVSRREFIDNYRLNVLTELALQKCSSVSLVVVIIINCFQSIGQSSNQSASSQTNQRHICGYFCYFLSFTFSPTWPDLVCTLGIQGEPKNTPNANPTRATSQWDRQQR